MSKGKFINAFTSFTMLGDYEPPMEPVTNKLNQPYDPGTNRLNQPLDLYNESSFKGNEKEHESNTNGEELYKPEEKPNTNGEELYNPEDALEIESDNENEMNISNSPETLRQEIDEKEINESGLDQQFHNFELEQQNSHQKHLYDSQIFAENSENNQDKYDEEVNKSQTDEELSRSLNETQDDVKENLDSNEKELTAKAKPEVINEPPTEDKVDIHVNNKTDFIDDELLGTALAELEEEEREERKAQEEALLKSKQSKSKSSKAKDDKKNKKKKKKKKEEKDDKGDKKKKKKKHKRKDKENDEKKKKKNKKKKKDDEIKSASKKVDNTQNYQVEIPVSKLTSGERDLQAKSKEINKSSSHDKVKEKGRDSKEYRHRSPIRDKKERKHRSPSPIKERKRRSPSPPKERKHRSPSYTKERKHRSPSPMKERKHTSQSPIKERKHRSPSPSKKERKYRSPSKDGKDSRRKSPDRRHRSPPKSDSKSNKDRHNRKRSSRDKDSPDHDRKRHKYESHSHSHRSDSHERSKDDRSSHHTHSQRELTHSSLEKNRIDKDLEKNLKLDDRKLSEEEFYKIQQEARKVHKQQSKKSESESSSSLTDSDDEKQKQVAHKSSFRENFDNDLSRPRKERPNNGEVGNIFDTLEESRKHSKEKESFPINNHSKQSSRKSSKKSSPISFDSPQPKTYSKGHELSIDLSSQEADDLKDDLAFLENMNTSRKEPRLDSPDESQEESDYQPSIQSSSLSIQEYKQRRKNEERKEIARHSSHKRDKRRSSTSSRDSPREQHSKRESELFGKDKYDRENKENVPYTESLRGSILERKERKRTSNSRSGENGFGKDSDSDRSFQKVLKKDSSIPLLFDDSGKEETEDKASSSSNESEPALPQGSSPYNPDTASPLDLGSSPGILGDDVDFQSYKDVIAFEDIMKKKVKREARRHKHKNKRRKTEDLPASIETDKDRKLVDYLLRQSRVEEEMKNVLKQYFKKKEITKEEYKNILKKAVPQVTMSDSPIIPEKIQSLMVKFIRKCKGERFKGDRERRKQRQQEFSQQQQELQRQFETAAMMDGLQPLQQIRVLNPNLPMPPM